MGQIVAVRKELDASMARLRRIKEEHFEKKQRLNALVSEVKHARLILEEPTTRSDTLSGICYSICKSCVNVGRYLEQQIPLLVLTAGIKRGAAHKEHREPLLAQRARFGRAAPGPRSLIDHSSPRRCPSLPAARPPSRSLRPPRSSGPPHA